MPVYPGLSIDVQLRTALRTWTSQGILTRFQSAAFELNQAGLYGMADFTVTTPFGNEALVALQTLGTKRIVYRIDDTPVYYGIMRKPVRSFDKIMGRAIQVAGLADELVQVYVKKNYAGPAGLDLSHYFFKLATDYLIPLGYCDYVTIDVLNTVMSNVKCDGTLRQVLTDLAANANGFVYWGLDVDPVKGTNLFVHLRTEGAPATYTFTAGDPVYNPATDSFGPAVALMEHYDDDEGLVNALYVTGGPNPTPNLAPNPSFEDLMAGPGGSNNLARNPDFELGANGMWAISHGATIRNHTDEPHLSGSYCLLLGNGTDTSPPGSTANQQILHVIPGDIYGMSWWHMAQTPGFQDAALVAGITWYDASNAQVGQKIAQWGSPAPPNANAAFMGPLPDFYKQVYVKDRCPATASYAVIQFQKTDAVTVNRNIYIDDVSFWDDSISYQPFWRTETDVKPTGDGNSPDTTSFGVDWQYDYAVANDGPGKQYGSYGVMFHTPLVAGHPLRIINSIDGSIPVKSGFTYNISVTARGYLELIGDYAFKGMNDGTGAFPSPYVNLTHLRIGVVQFTSDETQIPIFQNDDSHVLVRNVGLGASWMIVGGGFKVDKHAASIRVFFEALVPGFFYIDGVEVALTPQTPTEFQPGETIEEYITVLDVYPSSAPQYHSIAPPNVGYGLREDVTTNPSVLTRADAIRHAKTIFDVRALPISDESVKVIQTGPWVLYRPDGFVQVLNTGKVLPALWPAHIAYEWGDAGLISTLELSHEMPRLDLLIERDRLRTVTAIGIGADSQATYIAPVSEEFTIVGGDARLTAGNTIFTVELQQPTTALGMEVSLRGFVMGHAGGVAPSFWDVAVDGLGSIQQLVITLAGGDAFNVGDVITCYYIPRIDPRGTATYYATKTLEYLVAAAGTPQNFEVFEEPLGGSPRMYLRGFRMDLELYQESVKLAPTSAAGTILVPSGYPYAAGLNAANLGELVEFAGIAPETFAVADRVAIAYCPDLSVIRTPVEEQYILGGSMVIVLANSYYQWPANPATGDPGSFAVRAFVGGLLDSGATFTDNGVQTTVTLSGAARPGDLLIILGNLAL